MKTRHRPTIAGLMAGVLFCGVGIAALRGASPLWDSAVLSLTLAVLGLAILGALFLRGESRAFWGGFAIFGGGYLALTSGPWFAENVGPRLVTTEALGFLHDTLHPQPPLPQTSVLATPYEAVIARINSAQAGTGEPLDVRNHLLDPNPMGGAMVVFSGPLPTAPTTRVPFQNIGQSLAALVLAVIGGRIAVRFFRRSANVDFPNSPG